MRPPASPAARCTPLRAPTGNKKRLASARQHDRDSNGLVGWRAEGQAKAKGQKGDKKVIQAMHRAWR